MNANNQFTTSATDRNNYVLAAAARDNYVCLSEDLAGALASFDLRQINPVPVATAIGQAPWNVAMAELPADGLVCAVYNAGDQIFSVVKIPSMQLLRTVRLVGLTPNNQLPFGQGGWQLAAFDSRPATGTAALLAQADRTLVFVNLATAQELRRVQLSGIPFRLAVDNGHGNAIVALADRAAGLTRFVKVNASNGTVTPLDSTANLLATGFAVSPDGTQLYAANRNQFRILATGEAPSNDLTAAAAAIVTVPSANISNTTLASTSSDDPTPSCGNGSQAKSVWYRFTAPSLGVLTSDTFGSSYNTILSVWTGSPGTFTEVACNDDARGFQSQVAFVASRGTTYFFMVSAVNNDGGALAFNLRFEGSDAPPIPPANFLTFIPHSAYGGGFLTRMFIENLGISNNAVTINRIHPLGVVIDQTTASLQPFATLAIENADSQRAQALTVRWIVIGSQAPISASALFDCCASGTQVTSAVGVLAQTPGTSFTAPFIFQRETTGQPLLVEGLAIANRSATANTVSVQLVDGAGNQMSSDILPSIPAFGQTALTVSDLPGVSAQLQGRDSFLGSLAITGTQSFAPVYVGNLGGRLFSLPLTPPSASETLAVIPHFVTGGGYVTRVFIKNLATGSNNITIQFLNQNGSVARTETVTLSAGQTIERTSGEASRTAPLSTQWMVITGNQPVLASALFDCCAAGPQVASAVGVLAQPPGSYFVAPFLFQREVPSTQPLLVEGLALANRAPTTNRLNISLINSFGTPVATDTLAPIPPFGQTALTVSDLPNVSAYLTGRNTFLGSLDIFTIEPGRQPFSPVIVGNLGGRLFSLPLTAK